METQSETGGGVGGSRKTFPGRVGVRRTARAGLPRSAFSLKGRLAYVGGSRSRAPGGAGCAWLPSHDSDVGRLEVAIRRRNSPRGPFDPAMRRLRGLTPQAEPPPRAAPLKPPP